MITRFSSPDCTESAPFRFAVTLVVWHSPLDCTNVVGCGLPPVRRCSHVFSEIEMVRRGNLRIALQQENQSVPCQSPPCIRLRNCAPANTPYSSSCPSEESCCCRLPQSTIRSLPPTESAPSIRENRAGPDAASPSPAGRAIYRMDFPPADHRLSFPGTWCSHAGSTTAECGNAVRLPAPET